MLAAFAGDVEVLRMLGAALASCLPGRRYRDERLAELAVLNNSSSRTGRADFEVTGWRIIGTDRGAGSTGQPCAAAKIKIWTTLGISPRLITIGVVGGTTDIIRTAKPASGRRDRSPGWRNRSASNRPERVIGVGGNVVSRLR